MTKKCQLQQAQTMCIMRDTYNKLERDSFKQYTLENKGKVPQMKMNLFIQESDTLIRHKQNGTTTSIALMRTTSLITAKV